jgi:hypothetical protein
LLGVAVDPSVDSFGALIIQDRHEGLTAGTSVVVGCAASLCAAAGAALLLSNATHAYSIRS